MGGGLLRDILVRDEPPPFEPGFFHALVALGGCVFRIFAGDPLLLPPFRSWGSDNSPGERYGFCPHQKEEGRVMWKRCSFVWSVSALVFSSAHWGQEVARPPAPIKGLELHSGDYTWKFGGYVKLDVIHDFDAIGSTDSFDVRTIPTSGETGSDNSTRIHARQSRLNLDVSGPSPAGNFRGFVEVDFFSDQNGLRLRHAYGSIGPVLGGQTWSTFMDEAAMPETIDFESPIAFPLVRQAQVRWTRELEGGHYFALAIEDPDSDVIPPTGVAGEVEEPLPDLNARVHLKNARGHVQLGLFGGMARFDPDAGTSDDVALWGLNLSTKLTTVGKDNVIVQATYGDGVGRYRGGSTAAPDADGDLEAISVLGLMGSYEHHWSDEHRSTVGYAWGEGDIPDGAPPTSNEELAYGFANLIWQFMPRAWVGLEYLYGERGTFDDEEGDAHRIQFALRYDL